MGFQISALSANQFNHLFGQDTEALAAQGIARRIVDTKPGFPCRVSLQDAEVGETVLLLNYEHHAAATPYRASHAIFVREGSTQARPARNEVPEQLRLRMLSVRAFDDAGMMIAADLADGQALEPVVEQLFANPEVRYLHLHNAKPGCYAARVDRA